MTKNKIQFYQALQDAAKTDTEYDVWFNFWSFWKNMKKLENNVLESFWYEQNLNDVFDDSMKESVN